MAFGTVAKYFQNKATQILQTQYNMTLVDNSSQAAL